MASGIEQVGERRGLGSVRGGLAAIRETMSEGMNQMGEIISQANTRPAELTATFSPETLNSLTSAIEALQAAQTAESAPASGATPSTSAEGLPHEIKIVNRVPRVILGVVREQFNLMQGWLAPLVEATQSQRKDMVYLKQRLDVALQQYRELLEKLEHDQDD